MECICGKELNLNDKNFNKIIKWSENDSNSVDNNKILDYRDFLSKNQERIKTISNNFESYKQRYIKIDEDLAEYENQLKINNNKLNEKKVDDKELNSNNKRLKKLEENITDYKYDIKELKEEIKENKEYLKDNKNKKQNLEKELNIKGNILENYNLVERLSENLDDIKKEFIEEIKSELSKVSTNLFEKFIDSKTKDTFNAIVVKDDYSLDILNWENNSFLANISRGQRQILSLAFIIALAKVAGDRTSIEVPLFMDTPFGIISGENRDNLIEYIPALTPQWILLATDTELGKIEFKKLREGKKLGKIYTIEIIENGYAKLIEQNINNFKPLR